MINKARVLKALSDKTRRDILELLKKENRMAAGNIAQRFSQMTQATISHHLSILTEANLIVDERKGKYIYYELNTTVIQDLIQWFLTLTKEGSRNES